MRITLRVQSYELVRIVRYLNEHHEGPYFIMTDGEEFVIDVDDVTSQFIIKLVGESFIQLSLKSD